MIMEINLQLWQNILRKREWAQFEIDLNQNYLSSAKCFFSIVSEKIFKMI